MANVIGGIIAVLSGIGIFVCIILSIWIPEVRTQLEATGGILVFSGIVGFLIWLMAGD